MDRNNQMKLFAIGTQNANPKEWTGNDEISLVLARNIEEAFRLACRDIWAEVDMSSPCYLMNNGNMDPE